jgi:raffinose/stachyose/melibiose transport system permease protein
MSVLTPKADAGQGQPRRPAAPRGPGDRDRTRRADAAAGLVVHGILLLFALVALAPIVVIVLNSFKTTPGIFEAPFALPDGETFSLGGYQRVFERGNFVGNYRNSLIVTVATTALTLVLSTLAAYGLTEYKVRLAPVLGGFLVLGIMLPIRLGTVPILTTMVSWRLMDTLTALILVYTAMSVPLAVALMMTYFRAVPADLKEAARIDGAGELRTLSIVLPLVRPGLAAVASVTMLPVWNDLWFPLILAPSPQNQTVTLGVQQFVGQFLNDYPALLAALTLGALPLVVLFTVFSRQFIQGLSRGIGR